MAKNKSINQKELVEALIEKTKNDNDLSKRQAEKLVKDLFDLIIDNLESGNSIKITGFGVFTTKKRHARKGVDPRNPSNRIDMPEVRVAKFKTGKRLKDALKQGDVPIAQLDRAPGFGPGGCGFDSCWAHKN